MSKDRPSPKITPEKEDEYKKLFEQLDFGSDGRIDVNDLKMAFKAKGCQIPGRAEDIIKAGDTDSDGELDLVDFIQYLHEHELKLRLMFKRFDRNEDGKLCLDELNGALKSVGIELSKEEVAKLLNHLDKDRDSKIDLDEWLEVQLLYPSVDLKDMVHYWKHESSLKNSGLRQGVSLVLDHPRQRIRFMADAHCVDKDSIKVVDASAEEISAKLTPPNFLDSGECLLVPDDYSDEERVSGLVFRRLIAGATAGAVSRTCTAPLDRLKVMMQVHANKKNQMSITSTFKNILKEGGARSFWRGNGVNVLKIAPETSIKFMAYEYIKSSIRISTNEDTGPKERFLAGACAGAISQTAVYPLEVVKTRLAIRKTGQYTGMFDCIKQLYKTEGYRCFFKGYVPNLMGIIPYAGIDLCVYETFRNQYLKRYGEQDAQPSSLLIITSGCLSTICGQFASYPFALVRTKMQAQAKKNRYKHEGMIPILTGIARSEGLFGLYRGLGANIMKVVPAVSISYLVYEKMRIRLGVAF